LVTPEERRAKKRTKIKSKMAVAMKAGKTENKIEVMKEVT
jgi:hypothetical protein